MASKAALLVLLNILFFTLVSSTYVPCPPPPSKKPHKKYPPAPYRATCPKDTLKIQACADVLNLVNVVIGKPKSPCCALVEDLVDLEAAVCLCTALKANVLGIKLNLSVNLTALLNTCGKKVPAGFQCF